MKGTSRSREELRREAADWLARLRGVLSETDRADFQRWHDADPAHAEAYDRVKAVYDSAGLLAQTQLGRNRGLPERKSSSWRRPYALAASVALLLVIAAAVLVRPAALMPQAEARILTFATRVGEIREIQLPDGSRMTLDTRTKVSIEIGGDRRQVTLREGRARFIVGSKDRRPFVVEAGMTRVTGHGSTFDVALHEGAANVHPIKGSVSLQSMNDRIAPVRLAPGQAILVSPNGDRRQHQARRSEALWPGGMLEFDDTSLGQAVVEANRYSHGRISLADPALASLRVNGVFRAGDLDGLARSLEAALSLRLERKGGQLILHPASSGASEAKKKTG